MFNTPIRVCVCVCVCMGGGEGGVLRPRVRPAARPSWTREGKNIGEKS